MKRLNVKDPWSTLITSGTKSIELRTWSTNYRGPIVICSSLGRWRDMSRVSLKAGRGSALVNTVERWSHIEGDLGAAVCIVDLVDVRLATARDALEACLVPVTDGAKPEYAWCLRNPRKVPHLRLGRAGVYAPFKIKGALGLLDVPKDLQAHLKQHRVAA